MRKTGTVKERLTDDRVVTYVIRDTHWDEWRVELWIDGEHQEQADYHTDDKGDAYGTARAMHQRALININ